jgi:putative ABC transport system substrate-binding protein
VKRRTLAIALGLAIAGVPAVGEAQQPRLYRLGVVSHGGQYTAAVDGLRDGLKQLGLEEDRHFVLHLRETKGDLKAVASMAKGLEAEKVDLIYSLATSVTLEVKRATKSVPVVFYAGTDPVAFGLVDSYRRPGGRLTGVYGRYTDLTGKRLQLLKEMIPGLSRVVTFYNPENPAARESIKIARQVANQLKVALEERTVASVEDLRAGLRALRPGEADAIFYVTDAMLVSQAPMVIDIALSKRIPTMFADRGSAERGALASYGVSYYAVGRLSAKQMQRILQGTPPGDLPVEQLDTPHLVINLKTAKALELSISPSMLTRADEVIQ